jgi:hypothetical protein
MEMIQPLTIEFCDVLGNSHSCVTKDEDIAQSWLDNIASHAEKHRIPPKALKFRMTASYKYYVLYSVLLTMGGDKLLRISAYRN